MLQKLLLKYYHASSAFYMRTLGWALAEQQENSTEFCITFKIIYHTNPLMSARHFDSVQYISQKKKKIGENKDW